MKYIFLIALQAFVIEKIYLVMFQENKIFISFVAIINTILVLFFLFKGNDEEEES